VLSWRHGRRPGSVASDRLDRPRRQALGRARLALVARPARSIELVFDFPFGQKQDKTLGNKVARTIRSSIGRGASMTRRSLSLLIVALAALAGVASASAAAELPLNIIQYPDRRSVDVPFTPTGRGPTGASLQAEVELKEGQARIEIDYRKMQPALLFGGNITCYVVWAVSRAGLYEDLGELFVDGE